jgi:hypothetical protein
MQKQYFDPPQLDNHGAVPRWSRKDGGIRRVPAET